MLLTIDSLDYTSALDLSSPPKISRTLNRPSTAHFALAPTDLPIPVANARVIFTRADGTKLFTGYLNSAPERKYLGWGERGPIYRLECSASSDEALLDHLPVPPRPAFVNRTAGDSLRRLTNSLVPGLFDLNNVADLDIIPLFPVARSSTWSQNAAQLAIRARASYRAHDGAIVFDPIGATQHSLTEGSPNFCPDGLHLNGAHITANQIIAVGKVEPRLWCKDYFLGDGVTLNFNLARRPFAQFSYAILDENYTAASLDPEHWTITDPTSAFSLAAGKLLISGGTGVDGGTTLTFAEQLELSGGLLLSHGAAIFSAASSGILGGIYDGAVSSANCLAGFQISADGSGQPQISAIINGVATGPVVSGTTGRAYALTTRLNSQHIYRATEPFHSSAHPAGRPRGGATIAADVRVLMTVQEIDPANATPVTVLYDGVLSSAPAYCIYAPVNAINMHASLASTRVIHVSEALVQSAPSGQPFETRIIGSAASGGECALLSSIRELRFYPLSAPAAGERVVVCYRGSGRASAQASDSASIASEAHGDFSGVRVLTANIASPPARTALDCENAALALLDDSVQPICSGEYRAWTDALDSDIWPGDALNLNVPSQNLNATAIVRDVSIELADPANDRSFYAIKFANDSAALLAFDFAERAQTPIGSTTIIPVAGATYPPDLINAEVTSASSGLVTIDAGVAPLSGGGIEVRRGNSGWGSTDDSNLIGRFTTQVFTVAKLTRVADYYLRQFDAATPPNYSRYSTALHVDQP